MHQEHGGYGQTLLSGMDERLYDQEKDQSSFLKFKKLKTNEARFNWAKNRLLRGHQLTFKESGFIESVKSAIDSERHRNEGNAYFRDKLYKKALDLYTKSIILAPAPRDKDNDRHLAKSLCNRSAALYYLKECEACLIDIEAALQAGYMEERQYLLYVRKVNCLHALELDAEATQAFDKVVELLTKSNLGEDQRARIIEELEDLMSYSTKVPNPQVKTKSMAEGLPSLPHGRNASHPSLSSSCKVMYDTDKGRYVVATRDIKPGEVILVEEPYCSLLYKAIYDKFCDHCYGKLPVAPIACQDCTKVLFCCPSCKDDAWGSYHKYECSMDIAYDPMYRLALRTVLVAGLAEILKYKDGSTSPATMPSNMTGCNEQGQYRSNDFNTVHHLVDHFEKLPIQLIHEITSMAAVYTVLLERANFFQSIPPRERESAILHVGKCLMHLSQAIRVNSNAVSNTNFSPGRKIHFEDIGIGLYPTFALLNHSCANNAIRTVHSNNLVMHAGRTIKEGEEVTSSYGTPYLHVPKEARQKKLQKSYYFKCSCEACVNNWPVYSKLRRHPTCLKCLNCQQPLNISAAVSTSVDKACPGCSMRNHIPTIENIEQRSIYRLRESQDLLSAGKFNEARVVIQKEIERVENMLVCPREDPVLPKLEKAMYQVCNLMGNVRIDA